MYSGGWELVGRNKKDKNNGKSGKLTKAEKKKFIENAPKVEDFLPLTQVKTLYDNLDNNKENKKPQKDKENKTKENQEKKKQQQQKHQAMEAKKAKSEEKPPKSIQDALNRINVGKFYEVFSTSLVRSPIAPLPWLRDLTSYLDAKIPIDEEDSIFSGKPRDYPLSIVPKAIIEILMETIDMIGKKNAQMFYESTLRTLPDDMIKGASVLGQKIVMQLLARTHPDLTIANIPHLISVRDSYQNRKSIGLSLLWVMAQGGLKNLLVGLKVWHEVMVPMIESKHYGSYVAQVLKDLVFEHETSTDLSPEVYLEIVGVVYSGKLNPSKSIARDITNSIDRLRSILFKNKNVSCTKLFETLMGMITPKVHADYRDELIKALADCLRTDPACFTSWRSIYPKNLYQSQLLLSYIESRWDILRDSFKTNCLKETCAVFQVTNEKWKKGRERNLGLSCSKLSKDILAKMTASSKRKFPWGKGLLLLIIVASGIFAYNVQNHASFETSSAGKLLKQSGAMEYGAKVWSTMQAYKSQGLEAVEARYPEYYKTLVDTLKPYERLAGDLYIVMRKLSIKMYDTLSIYAKKQGPVIIDTIEHYVPGMLEQITLRTNQGVEMGKEYLQLIAVKVSEHSAATMVWLGKNVFVGKLSRENLESYATQAFYTTQTVASQTYDWVYEKVQTFAKVP